MRAQQFPGGHANLTYLLQFDDRPPMQLGARGFGIRFTDQTVQ